MSFLLWTDEAADAALDLGDPFEVWKAFADMERVADGGSWAELFAVPDLAESEVEPEYLAKVQKQSGRFLQRCGHELMPQTRRVLEILSTGTEPADSDGPDGATPLAREER